MSMESQIQNQSMRWLLAVAVAALLGASVGSFVTSKWLFQTRTTTLTQTPETKGLNPHVVQLIEEESATIAVVDDVAPSVASIIVKKQQRTNEWIEVSSGTGFFVTEDGLLLTNRHVVDESGVQYVVVTNDGKEYEAVFVDADPFQDIAILQVQGTGFHPASLGQSNNVRIGQTVIAIGNTLSEFRNTVTKGVVSGIDRRVTAASEQTAEVIEKAIQTDAAINPGNSGGPLINLFGEVIGINTAVSAQGASVGFAIPIDQAKRAIDDVLAYGRIVRPWLGVRYVLVEPESSDQFNITYELGALISSGQQPGQEAVFSGSPAAAAGLQEGDIIIAINDHNLTKASALSERISDFHPGDEIKMTFLRQGVIEETMLTLVEFLD